MSSAESTRRDERARNVSVNEPTTSRHERRTSLQAGRFLKSKHPELFEITPLPGGYRPRSVNRRDEIASRSKSSEAKVRMCSIAVSTVMMLAQRTYDDITMEHVRHTQEYFHGLKQPDGYPANVRQFTRLLTHLKEGGKVHSSVEEEESNEEAPVQEPEPQEPEPEEPINTNDT